MRKQISQIKHKLKELKKCIDQYHHQAPGQQSVMSILEASAGFLKDNLNSTDEPVTEKIGGESYTIINPTQIGPLKFTDENLKSAVAVL
jgi:hypothetical protein